jgi:hypothetical protein
MIASNKIQTMWRRAAECRLLLLMLCVGLALGPRAYAQGQAPANTSSAQTQASTETSADVAKELQEVKTRMAQMESQLKELAAFVTPSVTSRSARQASTEVTLTGTVSCSHCQGIQPLHKGYTQYTWALNSVSQGDDIVLVSNDQVYKLQGNSDDLLKLMSSKARATGRLDGNTLQVETISRAVKGE